MSTLLLKLAAPLQSWGSESHFQRRGTRHEPTKSGVIGLIAAAQGRRRTDSIEDLLGIRFGVRVDQPGEVLRDLQTAHDAKGNSMPFPSYRYYLSDAIFVVGLESDQTLLEGIEAALLQPLFPLFLGRRSCVPSGKLVLKICDMDLVQALRTHPWEASQWYIRKAKAVSQVLPVFRDALPTDTDELSQQSMRDLPQTFSQQRREYGWRDVIIDDPVIIETDPHNDVPLSHDPMAALDGD